MAIQHEIWVQEIQDKLFAGNEFVNKATSHDAFVNYKTVHIPQAGTIPSVQKDRSSLPATISQRTDTDKNYNLSEFTTDPMLITNLEEIQTSYDKRQSVISHHVRKLGDRLGLEALYQWAGATLAGDGGQIILTAGDAVANIAPPGATGSRLQMQLKEVADAAALLDDQDAPQEDRYLVVPSKMYWDFVEDNKTQLLNLDYNKSLSNEDIATGIVSKVYGFNIITRSYTAVYADAATPTLKAVGAATATTDQWGAVGFQSSMVARAMGSTEMFEDLRNPTYYGDVYSILQMFAATKMRTDGKGIVTIVQNS